MILIFRKLFGQDKEIVFGVFSDEAIADAEINEFCKQFIEFNRGFFRAEKVELNKRLPGNGSLGL